MRLSLMTNRHTGRHTEKKKRHADVTKWPKASRERHGSVTKSGSLALSSRPVALPDASALRVLALVPARGGSKGIPRKNLQLLAGRPLVAHAVGIGLAASLVSRVVCSTDDPDIAEAAR